MKNSFRYFERRTKMGVTVRIVETYVKEVYVEHTDDFYEAKEYVANNRSKFQIDLNEDFCECNYE